MGFGLDGVVILRNNLRAKTFTAIKDFCYNTGWRVDRHIRLVADVTGDGTGDLVGFSDAGVFISTNNGDNSYTSPTRLALNDFGYNAGGWRIDKHLRYLADIRGVGHCDIVGFGNSGVVVSKNDGDGNFNPARVALSDFGCEVGGWRLDRHLRFLGDTTGDGLPDIVGFGEGNVFVSRNNGNATFAPARAVLNTFCYSAGWRVDQHPRFIADLTGDGKVDLIGCGDAGVHVSLNQGNGTFGPLSLAVHSFGTSQGWKVDQHLRFIADLTGNKRGDIIGFGDAGVYVSYNNGNGTFEPAKLVLNCFGVQQTWKVSEHPRFVVDLTGDGRADIIGFGNNHVYVSYNDGKGGFEPFQTLTGGLALGNGQSPADRTVRWLANLNPTN